MRTNVRGFTLVEVVVAITILSLIILATVTAMRTLADTQTKLETKIDQVSTMVAVTQYLRKTIADAQPVTLFEFGAPVGIYFYGTKDSIRWATPIAIPEQSRGVLGVSLSLVDGKVTFNLDSTLSESDINSAGSKTSYTLLEGVEELSVRYRSSVYGEWLDDWGVQRAENQLPSHISLRLKVSGRYWPEIIIATSQAGL
ncbi:prepilin-type N-terminal cleavage/methylation domain-containing protein [Gilvimarinus chinensis]|uniref:prepilin-type N-terminal cleavage/methylation domain-containing protein n=1 Tax=Gilvimarinus chinensis TaxID=396005 RepID=UPI00036B82AA|nr:prepilin-type N-terminal cleavage/methylation domain-containing protein [Gilvimarinus chinensis]